LAHGEILQLEKAKGPGAPDAGQSGAQTARAASAHGRPPTNDGQQQKIMTLWVAL